MTWMLIILVLGIALLGYYVAGRKDRSHAYEIREEDDRLGVLAVFGPAPDTRQSLIIRTTATQLAIALEREKLVSEREKIRLAMRTTSAPSRRASPPTSCWCRICGK